MGRYAIVMAAVLAAVVADASVAFAQKTTEIPWSSGALDAVMKEAKDRNVPLFIYSGNDT